MKTCVIIACAGQGKRREKKTPKQMEPINGIPNVKRIHSMVLKSGINPDDIFITVNMENGEYFPSEYNLVVGNSSREIDRFRNGFSIIPGYDKTIFLYGDVVYHTDDLTQILSGTGYTFFGRKKGNKLTGKEFGELFGISITMNDEFIDNVKKVALDFDNGVILRELGWELYRSPYHKDIKEFFELSSFTDDYDTIPEFKIIMEAFFGK